MADALCGPSNALQNFQKHTTVDRTLQQDRIALRQQFEQGFRSSPGPNAGVLDAEFEAFQAGLLDGGLHDPQPFAPTPFQDRHAPASVDTGSPSWATDLQSMRFNDVRATPIPQSQFRREAPIQHTVHGGWHHDFMRQQTPPAVFSPPQQQRLNASYRDIEANSYNTFSQANMLPIAQQKQPERQQVMDFLDQKDMERAFEAVSMEQREFTETPSSLVDMAREFKEMYPYEEIRVGSDRILDESMRDEDDNKDKNDADELARTAGQLLDNVKHDQSQKFQQSSFLSLMRQLRDREVHVEGDQLVDTPQPLHPGGQFYPEGGLNFIEDYSDQGSSFN